MSNMLVRGIPRIIHIQIQNLAKKDNLSVNQAVLQLLRDAVEQARNKTEEEECRAQAFRRMEELRLKFRRKYGRQEDSTKLVREMRDERSNKWV